MPSIINATTTTGVAVTGDTSGALALQTNNGTTAVTIDTSQNVGIGTSSPTARLGIPIPEFSASSTSGMVRFQNPNVAADSCIQSYYVSSDGSDINIGANSYVNTSGSTVRFSDSYASSAINIRRDGVLAFRTNTSAGVASERMRIDSSGNVGIGTSSPSTKLHVEQSTTGDAFKVARGGNYLIMGGSGSGTQYVKGYEGTVAFGNAFTGNTTFLTGDTERGRFDSSGNFLFNSGYGSVATAYGCRAWVNFDGTGTVAIRGSGNVSSIADNGTGDYTLNFSTAMPDANYSVQVMGNRDATGNYGYVFAAPYNQAPTTSAVRIATSNTSVLLDFTHVFVAVFR